ncbi:ribonuclease HI [Aeromonas phage Akh-2]|nr:ribonuclease HI [Aeromonas phage Akh-2]
MYNIFTDGACRGNPGAASWAFVVYNSSGDEVGHKSGIDGLSTNNAMELEAILSALCHVATNADKYKSVGGVTIHTDSAFCVNVVTQWMDGWQANGWTKKSPGPIKNLEVIKKIHKYWHICGNTVGNVQLAKVAGHSGVRGNERADELCNIALDTMK